MSSKRGLSREEIDALLDLSSSDSDDDSEADDWEQLLTDLGTLSSSEEESDDSKPVRANGASTSSGARTPSRTSTVRKDITAWIADKDNDYAGKPPDFLAGVPATMELRQDVVTINPTTNTFTLSMESYDRLTKYLSIKSFTVGGQEHEVTSYSLPNSETCKGIIYIDRVCLGEVIYEKDILPMLYKTPPPSKTKSPPSTKKQEPLPKKKKDEDWPLLSAAPSNKTSSPPQCVTTRKRFRHATGVARWATERMRAPTQTISGVFTVVRRSPWTAQRSTTANPSA
ncbi:hypothetical protein HPB49_016935 [Dermacentor silvarum]|uniref:Uncharacterized protein n=1 Tax=Dermacentor silvarum TaxID=543639 RepID=A0ACB8D6W0_DERSI|nr:hypothetical protein HPB49_016935 [Dermacentor silvarum]